MLIKPGDVVPGNMYFTTTRLHQELAGGTFVDVIIRRGARSGQRASLQGQRRPRQAGGARSTEVGAERIPYVCVGRHGQHGRRPADRRWPTCAQVRALCRQARHPRHPRRHARGRERLLHQAARAGLRGPKPIAEILKELCSYTDGCTMSGKKDAAGQHRRLPGRERRRDLRGGRATWWWSTRACTPTAAWPAATWRPWPAASTSRSQDDHIRARVGQVEYLGQKLIDCGRARSCMPIGGHGVFLDARAFYPHLPQDAVSRPDAGGRALRSTPACAAMERGIVSAGRDNDDRRAQLPEARAGAADDPAPRLHAGPHGRDRRVGGRGLRPAREGHAACEMVYEPKYLRFFQARFERL